MITIRRNAFALALVALAAPLAACFQNDCTKPIPAPPQFLRVPLPAQVLEPNAVGWGIHWGVNDKSNIAGQNEGSTWFRASLGSSGLEPVFGFGGPNFIPFMELRAQLLGQGWHYGPFLTLEAGGDLMPSRHIGLALGCAWGPVSPFVAARVGHSLDINNFEAAAGVAIFLHPELSINASIARRWDQQDPANIIGDTATLALDWHVPTGSPRPRHARRRASQDEAEPDNTGFPVPPSATTPAPTPVAAVATPVTVPGDPCAFSATIDAFDPARWEARARCLDALGKPEDARAARAKAKELRRKDTQAQP